VFSTTFRYALISLLELYQSLAGSNEAKVQAATTLADLQQWSHNKSQP
jgi:hypothetical protein